MALFCFCPAPFTTPSLVSIFKVSGALLWRFPSGIEYLVAQRKTSSRGFSSISINHSKTLKRSHFLEKERAQKSPKNCVII